VKNFFFPFADHLTAFCVHHHSTSTFSINAANTATP